MPILGYRGKQSDVTSFIIITNDTTGNEVTSKKEVRENFY